MKKKKNVKMIVTVIVLLFIPVAVAGLILYQNLQEGLFSGKVRRAEVSFADGEKAVFESEDEIGRFKNAVKSGENTHLSESDLNKPLSEYEPLEVLFVKTSEEYRFTFYLSPSANDCLYVAAGEKEIRHVQQAEAQAVLNLKPVYERVMEFVSRPEIALILPDGEKALPAVCRGKWVHVAYDGAQEAEEIDLVSELLPYSLAADSVFSVEMPLKPDYANLRILDQNGSQLWSGKPEEFSVLPITTEQVFTVAVDCDWYENPARAYQGHLEFSFSLFYDRPVTHSLSLSSVHPGQMITLSLSHTQSQEISVTCTFPTGEIAESSAGFEKSFVIPVAESAVPGEFSILVLGSDVDLTLPVTVLPKV